MTRRRRILAASLILNVVAVVDVRVARACYAIAVGKDASADGAVVAGHLEQNDASRYIVFRKVPRKEHAPEETVTLQRGREIPQVPLTWAYLWSHIPDQEYSDGYLNEWGVSIVSDACPSRYSGSDLTDGEIGYWLRRLVAERAKTSREGVQIAGALIEELGYAGAGRTYVVADPNEVWALAVVHGRHWVAQRVPDGEVMVVPNIYVIQEVDLADAENFMGASDIISFATDQGWYDPDSGEPFRFRKAYGDPAAIDARQRAGQRLLTGDSDPSTPDEDLPFSVVPSGSLAVKGVIDHLRSFDTLGTTQEGAVFQLRNWLPAEIASIYWRTTGAPSYSALTPWYAGILRTPGAFFDEERSAWVAVGALHDHASNIGGNAFDYVQGVWAELEARVFQQYPTVDTHAVDLTSADAEASGEFLTGYSGGVALKAIQLAQKMTADWIANPEFPVALATAAPMSDDDSLTITCDGFALVGAGRTAREYAWDFGDGAADVGKTTSHRYVGAGQYVVRLTVVDDLGNAADDAITVDVVAPEEDADNGSGCSTSAGAGAVVLLILLCAAWRLRRAARPRARASRAALQPDGEMTKSDHETD
jgi:dipeptidase